MNNGRKQINKHFGNNYTAYNLACKAIRIQGSVRDGLTTYEYNKETNTLTVSDGIVTEYYNPKILGDDLIFPFNVKECKD